jgi:ribosomal protein S18 acetylase RimI-like enzyme
VCDRPAVADLSEPPAEVLRMRVELAAPLPAPAWPAGVRVRGYRPADASGLHALLAHAYRHGGGSVDAFEPWREALEGDAEFDPALCVLAADDEGLAGAAICWTSAFVKDLVVHERWRRRGLGEAVLRHALGLLAARGAVHADLKVHAPNDAAIRLYERLGFRVVERLPA